jgi:hypothetical protein
MIKVTVGVNTPYYINPALVASVSFNNKSKWTVICLTGSAWERHVEVHESVEEVVRLLEGTWK